MQAQRMACLAARCGRPAERQLAAAAAAAGARRSNSFIREVMDQVKRDMESNEKLKKDWDSVRRDTEKLKEKSSQGGERLSEWGATFGSTSSRTAESMKQWKESAEQRMQQASKTFNETTEGNEQLKDAREFMRRTTDASKEGGQVVFTNFKSVASNAVNTTKNLLSFMDDGKTAEKLRGWQEARKSHAAAAEAAAAAKEATDKAAEAAAEAGPADAPGAQAFAEARAQPPPEPQDALVVSDRGNSSWDRFGAGIRDMPFLNSVFDNPLMERLFGESEIAASIREMKQLDHSFHLEDFTEDIEYVVAPHIVSSFLEGDAEALKRQCGDEAFLKIEAGIKTRQKEQMTLDTSILAGPREVELKGAVLNDKGAPQFVWTFNTQQVNCLKDKHGEIIEGAIDDIRTVYYAMVVTKHPKADDIAAQLEYPWIVSELAIVGNQPCW